MPSRRRINSAAPRPSAASFRRTNRKMKRASLHSPVTPAPRLSGRGSFATSRWSRKATRQEITHVTPRTSSGESRRAYESRVNRQGYIERAVSSDRKRTLGLVAVLAVLAVALAAALGSLVFLHGINARMTIHDAALTGVLSESPEEGSAVYTLLAASYDDGDEGPEVDLLILLRTNPDDHSAYAIAIPGNTRATLTDGANHRIGDALGIGGDYELVYAAEQLMGVQISHYVRTDAAGFESMVDALGGVRVTLEQDVVDEQAQVNFEAGTYTLSGAEALGVCRANDYAATPEELRGNTASAVALGLLDSLADLDSRQFYRYMDRFAGMLKTDLKVRDAYKFLSTLSDIRPSATYAAALPTYSATTEGVPMEVCITDDLAAMMERIRAGLSPREDPNDVIATVDKQSFSIIVNNGGAVVGAAADAGDMLESAGFWVESVGNTGMQVYDETLIIYQDDSLEEEAMAVQATLGCGRTVRDYVYYAFDSDVYVVVGNDWQAVIDARQAG